LAILILAQLFWRSKQFSPAIGLLVHSFSKGRSALTAAAHARITKPKPHQQSYLCRINSTVDSFSSEHKYGSARRNMNQAEWDERAAEAIWAWSDEGRRAAEQDRRRSVKCCAIGAWLAVAVFIGGIELQALAQGLAAVAALINVVERIL
jgi:hypothetical protein